MVNFLFLGVFAILFLILTWRRFEWGLFLLFLLLPTYLIRFHVGPIPSTLLELMILSLIGVFILKNFRNFRLSSLKSTVNNFFTRNKLLSIGILLFLLGATISIFTSIDIRKAAGEWRAFYIEPILLFFVLSAYLKNLAPEKRKETIQTYIILPLLLCGLATSLLAIYQHFTGWLIPHAFWANRNTYRVTGWYGFPNAVGLFLAPLIPLALHLAQKKWTELKHQNWRLETRHIDQINSRFQFFISLVFLFTAPFAILFAKGSGPIIGVAAGIGVLLLCYKKTRMAAIIIAVLGVVGIILLPSTHALKQEIFAQNYSGKIRRDMWHETLQLLKDRPVLGAGLASYEERVLPYRQDRWIEVFHHPHNIFLTIWVNTGIIGLAGFLFILIWFIFSAIRKIKESTNPVLNFAAFLLSTMSIILVMGLVDSPYIKNDLSILFWILPTLLFVKITHDFSSKKA